MGNHTAERQSKKGLIIAFVILIIVLLVGAYFIFFNKSEETSTKTQMTAEEITNKLKEKGLNIGEIVVYTEETDPNNLLGRPNQYASKTTFADTRLTQPEKVTAEELKENGWSENEIEKELISQNAPVGGTIEVFNNKEDMQKRKDYVESITSSISMLVQYIYSNDYVLLRLESELTPTQAQEYETAFNEIMNEKN